MNQDQMLRIRASWRKLEPQAGRVAEAFYAHLFDLDPDLKSRFARDREEGGEKWISAVEYLVEGLENPRAFFNALGEAARLNRGWELTEENINHIGMAFLLTLELELEQSFTSVVRAAWMEAYANMVSQWQQATRAVA